MKKAVILLAVGFEEIEALTVVDVLRRAEISCDICSIKEQSVTGSHGIKVTADSLLQSTDFEKFDIVILPGGMPGAKNLRENPRVLQILKEFNEKGKLIAALCAAPTVLLEAGILSKREITSFPSFKEEFTDCNYIEEITHQDNNIITSRGPATAIYFALKIVENLSGKASAEKLKENMLINFVEDKIKVEK